MPRPVPMSDIAIGGVQMSSTRQMWDRFGKTRMKALKATDRLRTANGGPVDFESLKGKEFDRVLTILPAESLTDGNIESTRVKLQSVLGPLTLEATEPGSGVAIIKLMNMTKTATELLALGRWRPLKALEPDSEGEKEQEILAIHKGSVVGTEALPVRKVVGGFNSVEVYDGQPTPRAGWRCTLHLRVS